MKAAIPLLLVALAGCARAVAPGGGGPAPRTIVSTNPCADAMLVELVPPARIAAISHYSVQAEASSMPLAAARRFATTAGTAEEVIALHPDLVVTSSFTPPATLAAYRRAGLAVLTLDSPTTIAASEAQIRTLAAALGARDEGEAMVGRIKSAVLNAAVPRQSSGNADNPSALLFIAGDLANGTGTLLDELMTRAGFRNAAADYGLRFTGPLPIETIAAHPPRVILAPDSSRTATLRTRVLARTGAAVEHASFPRKLVNCGGPSIVPALQRLAQIRRSLTS
ncbi:MAG: ABC transporter substrate-binding protein [Sphingomonas sp.]|jgi:iron complex transport system substrate-binding protein|uniref:ABC transporter substrate-binding protein n=1 Tax=Sphingomonas sp. TaxID=28214 RepID=UPI00356608E4